MFLIVFSLFLQVKLFGVGNQPLRVLSQSLTGCSRILLGFGSTRQHEHAARCRSVRRFRRSARCHGDGETLSLEESTAGPSPSRFGFRAEARIPSCSSHSCLSMCVHVHVILLLVFALSHLFTVTLDSVTILGSYIT